MKYVVAVLLMMALSGCSLFGGLSEKSRPGELMSTVLKKEGQPSEVWAHEEYTHLVWMYRGMVTKGAMFTPGTARVQRILIDRNTGEVHKHTVEEPRLLWIMYRSSGYR